MAKPTKTSLPVYDDFGNHIGIPPEKRTYERRQGCWNCTAFECGELYRRRVQDCHRRDVKAYLARGFGLHAAGRKAEATSRMLLDKAGIFGLCLKGKVPGDFVGCKHLCVDGWSGRVGVMGSLTPGQALDEPVAALYDEHGAKITTDGELVDPTPDKAAAAEHKAKVAAQAEATLAKAAEPILIQSTPVATADISEEKLTFVPITLPEPIVAKFNAEDVQRDVVTPAADPVVVAAAPVPPAILEHATTVAQSAPTLVVHTDKPFDVGKLVPEVAVLGGDQIDEEEDPDADEG